MSQKENHFYGLGTRRLPRPTEKNGWDVTGFTGVGTAGGGLNPPVGSGVEKPPGFGVGLGIGSIIVVGTTGSTGVCTGGGGGVNPG